MYTIDTNFEIMRVYDGAVSVVKSGFHANFSDVLFLLMFAVK